MIKFILCLIIVFPFICLVSKKTAKIVAKKSKNSLELSCNLLIGMLIGLAINIVIATMVSLGIDRIIGG